MAKVEQHDLSEFHIYVPVVATAGGGVLAFIPIPQAGYLKRVTAIEVALHTGDVSVITFEIGSIVSAQTLTITNTAAAVGRTHVVEFSKSTGNLVREAQHLDLLAANTACGLEIISDGGSTLGSAAFIVTFGR
jgi:hypothetical protein